MKRLFLTVVALLSMTMTFAENENTASVNTVAAYDMTVNMNKLSDVLNLNDDQIGNVADIHKAFVNEMRSAAMTTGDEREKKMNRAITKDLVYMRYVLSREQFRTYRALLNMTLVNRGLVK